MNLDTETIIALAEGVKAKTGETYLSLRFSIDLHESITHINWEAYTPMLGHSGGKPTPSEALSALLALQCDTEKLREAAEALEAKAKMFRDKMAAQGGVK